MSPRRATSLLLALVAVQLSACGGGGSSGSPSGGSPNPTAPPASTGNPCTAALGALPAVAAASASVGSKAGPLGFDDRDPREFVALHQLAGGGVSAAESAVAAQPRSGDIAILKAGKTKELIAIAASLAAKCQGCLEGHVKKALKFGATREEVSEAIAIAIGVNAAAIVDLTDIAADNMNLRLFPEK